MNFKLMSSKEIFSTHKKIKVYTNENKRFSSTEHKDS